MSEFQVDNETHCDFSKLQEMLLTMNMVDLIEITHLKHHQIYRSKRLKELEFNDNDDGRDCAPTTLMDVYNRRLTEYITQVQQNDANVKILFIEQVKEKEAEIKFFERQVFPVFCGTVSFNSYFLLAS